MTDAILEGLNEQQKEAVCCLEGPLLVLAGPGTGKTRVITRRIANLMAHGVDPRRILGVTFTNKAAGEMRSRVQALVGGASPLLCTFHSFCARFLRIEGPNIGLSPDYTIYDEEDSANAMKNVAKAMGLDEKQFPARSLRRWISNLKNRGIGPDGAPSHTFRDRIIQEVYAEYEKLLRRSQALDFDDLLLRAVRLLEENTAVRERYQDRYRYILVDEYQDTNACQYHLMKILGDRWRNVCATGDPDQSIYGWRGADIRNILNFEKDYPDAKVIRLEENYRSTGTILRCASSLIRHNRSRKEKDVWTRNPAGRKARLAVLADDSLEAYEVAATAEGWMRSGFRAGDIAVFYRTNAQSRPIEAALVESAIPYRIVGATMFYERKEIKDILAYLRLVANPSDEESLRRVINVPRRGLGEAVVKMLEDEARRKGIGLAALVFDRSAWPASLGGRRREALEGFADLISKAREKAGGKVETLVRHILDATGYLESLDEREEADRIANVEELVNAAAQFDADNPDGGLTRYLEEVALLTGVDRWDPSEDRVTLMTLHMAKGLEFPAVIITGLEDGLLPLQRIPDDRDDEDAERAALEEERRLFFVGITRAKRELVLMRAKARRRYGDYRTSMPSRFLDEIPRACLQIDDKATPSWAELHSGRRGGEPDDRDGFETYGRGCARRCRSDTDGEFAGDGAARRRRSQEGSEDGEGDHSADDREPAEQAAADDPPAKQPARRAAGRPVETDGGESQESPFDIEPGDRVSHHKFGVGVVESVTGSGLSAKATVRFRAVGRKILLLSMARLKKE
ncbi:MAG: UvrD-helicase domain-containing protein [Planctomycetota bacterium]|nr:UvrD-helicase domain-containing protein [Planctomycetota bacterium]